MGRGDGAVVAAGVGRGVGRGVGGAIVGRTVGDGRTVGEGCPEVVAAAVGVGLPTAGVGGGLQVEGGLVAGSVAVGAGEALVGGALPVGSGVPVQATAAAMTNAATIPRTARQPGRITSSFLLTGTLEARASRRHGQTAHDDGPNEPRSPGPGMGP